MNIHAGPWMREPHAARRMVSRLVVRPSDEDDRPAGPSALLRAGSRTARATPPPAEGMRSLAGRLLTETGQRTAPAAQARPDGGSVRLRLLQRRANLVAWPEMSERGSDDLVSGVCERVSDGFGQEGISVRENQRPAWALRHRLR
jgi:hypothetical protein